MLRIFAVVVPIAILATDAVACSEPSTPWCVNSDRGFSDRNEFNNCRRDMENYKTKFDNYLACMRNEMGELRRKTDAAVRQYTIASDDFSLRAGR